MTIILLSGCRRVDLNLPNDLDSRESGICIGSPCVDSSGRVSSCVGASTVGVTVHTNVPCGATGLLGAQLANALDFLLCTINSLATCLDLSIWPDS